MQEDKTYAKIGLILGIVGIVMMGISFYYDVYYQLIWRVGLTNTAVGIFCYIKAIFIAKRAKAQAQSNLTHQSKGEHE